jgi:hypothetical protein
MAEGQSMEGIVSSMQSKADGLSRRVEIQKSHLLRDQGIWRYEDILVVITEQERLSEPQLLGASVQAVTLNLPMSRPAAPSRRPAASSSAMSYYLLEGQE